MMDMDSDSDLEITGEGSDICRELPAALQATADALAGAQLPVLPYHVRAAAGAASLVSGLHPAANDKALAEAALMQAEDFPEELMAQHKHLEVHGKGFATLQDDQWLQVRCMTRANLAVQRSMCSHRWQCKPHCQTTGCIACRDFLADAGTLLRYDNCAFA